MATLSRELRKTLERVVLAARREAEAGARKALDQLAVAHTEPWPTMTSDQQALRRRLRARGRQLGDHLDEGGRQSLEHLVTECAYEQWHRMLFARFLAECELLIEPASRVSISVEECKELARARGVDWISLASAFAQGMLPQIFRPDEAVLEVGLPAEHRQPLEHLLSSLPSEVFLSADSLGWVYQFWQTREKDRVNDSETKIDADELPVVTQLFTEDYMVKFLLHNTLGAWWAGKVLHSRPELAAASTDESEVRSACALPGVNWSFLRLSKDLSGAWRPSAGTFDGWPKRAKDITLIDPCMGGGHFLVYALQLVAAIRSREEAVPLSIAVDRVLADNLFGLEVDPRCTQIAAFNLALTAWRLTGYHALPSLRLACSGLSVGAQEVDWLELTGDDHRQRTGMAHLHRLFAQAPILGSLIDPRALGGDILEASFGDLAPLLEQAAVREGVSDSAHEMAITAHGLAEAASLLARQFTLVATNVPYLGRGRQADTLKSYCESRYPHSKTELATCFVERCLAFCGHGGSAALVTPQAWTFQASYRDLRKHLLTSSQFDFVARVGPGGFETISGEVVNVALFGLTNAKAALDHRTIALDVTLQKTPAAKATALAESEAEWLTQMKLLDNPAAKIISGTHEGRESLGKYVVSFQGVKTGDDPKLRGLFWERPRLDSPWIPFQSTVDASVLCGGRSAVLRYESDGAEIARNQGLAAWGKLGVVVSQMSALPATLYTGEPFDSNVAPLVVKRPDYLPAVWEFCSSPEFVGAVRGLDKKVAVANGTFAQVPFEYEVWRERAARRFPHGLPPVRSGDPTQWVCNGHPASSTNPLHVAVARLLGYRWPRQTGSGYVDCPPVEQDGLERDTDDDGIVTLTAIKGEAPAAQRLSQLLATAFGKHWSAEFLSGLLAGVGYGGRTLDDWLRDGFFEQHCATFLHRPFIWHVWDGRRDGFSALINYHKLTRAALEKLTYAYLGDWIARQQAAVREGESASDARLVAARQLQQELKGILDGEPPYDIFVRWKELARQAIGWEPDLSDGVCVNIRPFLAAADLGKKGAGVLRAKPNVKWEKDRGKEPLRQRAEYPWFWGWDEKTRDFAGGRTFDGNRWNGLHYSREFKMAARRKKGLA